MYASLTDFLQLQLDAFGQRVEIVVQATPIHTYRAWVCLANDRSQRPLGTNGEPHYLREEAESISAALNRLDALCFVMIQRHVERLKQQA